MVKCSAPLCGNATYKKTAEISFHRFPKDENIKLAWLSNIKRPDWQPTSASEPFQQSLIWCKTLCLLQQLQTKDRFCEKFKTYSMVCLVQSRITMKTIIEKKKK
ncbi:unnamed protein product, partial [Iphiclides podalirius]